MNKSSQKGSAEAFIIIGLATALLLIISFYIAGMNTTSLALGSEARSDFYRIIDKISLGLASETECQAAFTSAPLNALSFVAGNPGSRAMTIDALPARGANLAFVGQSLTGGTVTDIWLENDLLYPKISNFEHYRVNLKIQAESSTRKTPLIGALQLGVLVDNSGKIQYCYLNESVAIKTCQITGGFFDPTKTPQCRFTFTGTQCNNTASCVRGVGSNGKLICSAPIPTPTPPPTVYMCVCVYPPNPTPTQTWPENNCDASEIAGAAACWLEAL